MFKSLKTVALVLAIIAAATTTTINAQIRLRQGPICTYDINPGSASVLVEGQSGITITVTTQGNCKWTAVSNNSFITVTGGPIGVDDGVVTLTVDANPDIEERMGTVSIANQTFTVTQDPVIEGVDPPDQPLLGAIRFDLFDRDFIPDNVEFELDKLELDEEYRARLPYYAVTTGPTTATLHEGAQAVVDQDILYAHDAGINFFSIGFACSYTNYFWEGMKVSPNKSLMKITAGLSSPLTCRADKVIEAMQDSQYLTVLGDRPVVIILSPAYEVSDGEGDNAGTAADIASFRARVIAETGHANPYIILQTTTFGAAQAAIVAADLGVDALTAYGGGLFCPGLTGNITYAQQAACEQTEWTEYVATGYQYMPTVTPGWQQPVGPLTKPSTATFLVTPDPTPTELGDQLTAALAYNASHASANLANLIMLSSWNEMTENHYIVPFNPATNAVGTGRLDAIAAVRNDPTPPCTYSLLPTSESSPAVGETGVDTALDTQPGCPWTSTSNVAWITITSGSSGTGDDTIVMDVAENMGGFRSGTVTIGGRTFTVNQSGVSSGSIISESDIDWQWCGQAQCLAAIPTVTPNGTCTLSFEPYSNSTTRNEGLTYRTISSTSYFYSTADKVICTGDGTIGELFRFHCTFSAAGTCTIDEEHGDIYDGKRLDINNQTIFPNGPNAIGPAAIHWQESTSNMWWTWTADAYGDGDSFNRSLGRSTLGSGTGTGIASYSFAGLLFARRTGAIVPIPSSFQGSFGGKEHFLCNNGYHSGGSSDIGLHCIALNLPSSAPDGTQVSGADFKVVIGHEWPLVCEQMTTRPAWLPALQMFPHCLGQLTDWFDIHNSCIFPDSGSHHGLLCFTNWNLGGVGYISAQTSGHGTRTGITVWDPADLAAVYADSAPTYSPQPINAWEVHWPGWDYNKFPFQARERTVTSVVGTAATEVYQFTFSTPHGLFQGEKFSTYGSTHNSIDGATGPDHGFTIMTGGVLNATTVLACRGQDAGDDGNCTSYGENYIPSDFTDTNPFTMITFGIVGGIQRLYGRIAGAVWMPTNSACGGQDNMIAVAYDVMDIIDDRGGLDFNTIRRVIRCGKVN